MNKADSLIERADKFAEMAHSGVVRKCTNAPFIEHPRRVAAAVRPYVSPAAIAAALLHDVVEDTKYKDLAEFPSRVRSIVKILTLFPGEEKADAVRRVLASFDEEAVLIKVADRTDNLRDGSVSFGRSWLRKYVTHTTLLYNGADDLGLSHHNLVRDLHAEMMRCWEILA